MSEIKTKVTDVDVYEFIESFANTERKKQDSYELIKMMIDSIKHTKEVWG